MFLLFLAYSLPADNNRWQLDAGWYSPEESRFRLEYSGGWGRIGVSSIFDGTDMAEQNFYFSNSFSVFGSLSLRGRIRDLILPDLRRNLLSSNREKTGVRPDTSFSGSSRKGFSFFLPGENGPGVFAYARSNGEWAGGGWAAFSGRRFRLEVLFSCSLPPPRNPPAGWILDNLYARDWSLFGAGIFWEYRLTERIKTGLIAGGACSVLDRPGGWGKGYFTWEQKNFLFHLQGGVSSPRAWKSDGGRVKDFFSWRLESRWSPWGKIGLFVEMGENQEHLSPYPGESRKFSSFLSGGPGLILKAWRGDLRFGRNTAGDEAGRLTVSYEAEAKLSWEKKKTRVLCEARRLAVLGGVPSWEYGFHFGQTQKNWGLKLSILLKTQENMWKRKILAELFADLLRVRLSVQVGLNRNFSGAESLPAKEFWENWRFLPGTGPVSEKEVLDFRLVFRLRF